MKTYPITSVVNADQKNVRICLVREVCLTDCMVFKVRPVQG